jgi:hypothetical protein
MSIAKRIIDLAKSNLNALLERAAETADPRRRLASIPDAELEAELARRRSARMAEEKIADAKARIDGAGRTGSAPMPDRAERERIAREREARVRAERARREQDAKARAQQASASAGARRPSSSAGAGPGPRPGPAPKRRDPQLARYYDRLEVPYGSDWATVKSAYRRLMRKYHPDLHGQKSADARRAATEVAQALTQAYNELEKVLVGGPNR